MYNEHRLTERKVLQVKARLTMEGAEPVLARTLDVGGEGVCLEVPVALSTGALGMVRFEVFHDGKLVTIEARSRVQYCILSHGHYKVGFRFVQVGLSAMAALSRFLH